jgi:hypothetical protein
MNIAPDKADCVAKDAINATYTKPQGNNPLRFPIKKNEYIFLLENNFPYHFLPQKFKLIVLAILGKNSFVNVIIKIATPAKMLIYCCSPANFN